MDRQALLVMLVLMSLLLITKQRADPTKRRAVRYFIYFSLVVIGIYVWWYRLLLEAVLAFVGSLGISGLFWLLIGRYNPPSSSDDIRVLGMDD